MRQIDLETWPRRTHFETFKEWDYPHFNLCANVELAQFYAYVKQRGYVFTTAFVYVVTRAANAIPEFRTRIRGDAVVEHEVVHPSTTVMADNELFTFCTMTYDEAFATFAVRAAEQITFVRDHPSLEDPAGRDDLLYMTAMPWVSFTSFMHPISFPVDSVPRFAWGKYFADGDSLKMPLGVQAHHALMDGLHMGRYYATVQDFLDHPEYVLG